MTTQIKTRLGLLLSIIALQFCCAGAIADDATDIRSRLEQWTTSFNNGDKAGACELFSKSLVSDGQSEAGYDERCAIISKALDEPQRSFQYNFDIKEVIVDKAMAVVRLNRTLKISPGDLVSTEASLDVFQKESDGRWRIIRYMAYSPD